VKKRVEAEDGRWSRNDRAQAYSWRAWKRREARRDTAARIVLLASVTLLAVVVFLAVKL
jgi:hypothetical protein